MPIESGFTKLASMITLSKLDAPLARRVLNANLRLGRAENAQALASFASRTDVPERLRVEAVEMLAAWAKPSGRDRVTGLWRPLPAGNADDAAAAVRGHIGGLFAGPEKVRQEAVKVSAKYGIKEVGPLLLELVGDAKEPTASRVEALRALEAMKDAGLPRAAEKALTADDANLRTEGRRVIAGRQPERALGLLKEALERGSQVDQQGAFSLLGDLGGAAADPLLEQWLDKLLAGQVAPELHLDLLQAAANKASPELKKKLAAFEATRPKTDPLSAYRETLAGGDAEAGKRIFLNRAEVSCLRCHKVQGQGVGEVGPDLTGIGGKQTREYLLEALVAPSKQIAKGYETVVLTLTSGKTVSGILKSETKQTVQLLTAEGQLVTVPVDKIDERTVGKSAMPEDLLKHLSKRDLRDLVEFLSGLK